MEPDLETFDKGNSYEKFHTAVIHVEKQTKRTQVAKRKKRCEPPHGKTNILHRRKQRRRSASR